jgi:hypothetical protein
MDILDRENIWHHWARVPHVSVQVEPGCDGLESALAYIHSRPNSQPHGAPEARA